MAQELRAGTALCIVSQSGPSAPSGTCNGGAVSLSLSGVKVEDSTVGLELGYRWNGSSTTTAGAAQIGLTVATNQTFGPLGNVVFELAGDLRTNGLAQAALGARGVLGPVAARVTFGAHGADAATFDPRAVASDERASFGGYSVALRLGLTGRLERNVIVDADPELYLTTDGLAGRLTARLRLLRTLGENELRLHLRAGATPGFTDAYGSLGAGVVFPRGRSPDLEFALHVGVAEGRVAPGAMVNLAENLPGGMRIALAASLEPYRLDVHPGRAAASLSLPLADGTLEIEVAGAFLDASRPAAAVVETSLRLPLALPGRR